MMKQCCRLALVLVLISLKTIGQDYRETLTKSFDLVHTKLEIKPDWQKQQLNGIATLKLKPHFYPQKTLVLDAKGFDIHAITMNNQALKFVYDSKKISIELGKEFLRKDTLNIQIKYTAKPNDLPKGGSEAITSDKGLYFINADGSDPLKPKQIWTQGETEASSCWFPTIDSPNMKSTEEVILTVDNQYITLSNGKLISSTKNADGTRTDYWKQDKPHAPYLFMFAVGDFKKVVDPNFKNFEVSYYVEPKFEPYAMKIFGRTPEMIRYFENIIGVKYQWDKYAQIAVREYVSGAMENTSATVHGDFIQKNANKLVDDNDDGVIAHELFHHWFGDLVTCESWSNLPLNESFATYAEQLWSTHYYGKDEGDLVALNGLNQYLYESEQKKVPMIRYTYNTREDMFDSHSYAKGGRILHFLRKTVGDEAFFEGLKRYLNKNKFGTAEIHDLRMALEDVTGKDLMPFFNQWFFQPGHPELAVSHEYKNGSLVLDISQTQDTLVSPIYNLPIDIEIWHGDKVSTQQITIDKTNQQILIPCQQKPDAVILDPESIIVGKISHQKSNEELIHQLKYSKAIAARLFALEKLTAASETDSLAQNPITDKITREAVLNALNDPFWKIRQTAIQKFNDYDGDDFLLVEKALQTKVKTDPRSQVRADAILAMKNFMNAQNQVLFRNALNDSSYMVQGAALEGLLMTNPEDADELVKKYENTEDANIFAVIANFYAEEALPEKYPWFEKHISNLQNSELYQVLGIFGSYLVKSSPEIQTKSLPMLKNIAMNNPQWFVRFAGVQSLALMIDLPEVKKILKEVVKNEKDDRLLKIYEQLKDL